MVEIQFQADGAHSHAHSIYGFCPFVLSIPCMPILKGIALFFPHAHNLCADIKCAVSILLFSVKWVYDTFSSFIAFQLHSRCYFHCKRNSERIHSAPRVPAARPYSHIQFFNLLNNNVNYVAFLHIFIATFFYKPFTFNPFDCFSVELGGNRLLQRHCFEMKQCMRLCCFAHSINFYCALPSVTPSEQTSQRCVFGVPFPKWPQFLSKQFSSYI